MSYFGGKSRIAEIIWSRIGTNLHCWIEPFAGSAAITLMRPSPITGREIINDFDCLLVNAWRSIKFDPDKTAEYAHNIRAESELHATHAHLMRVKADVKPLIEHDREWFDAKLGGYWLYGICMKLGGGWCSGEGPWYTIDGKLMRIDKNHPLYGTGKGITRSVPCVGNRGVLCRTLPELTDIVRGLSRRLQDTLILNGDWSRAVTPAMMSGGGKTGTVGIVFDPPYGAEADYESTLYAAQDKSIAVKVRQWCLENGTQKNMRIAYCGYYSGQVGTRGGGEGDILENAGWSIIRYSSAGGYGSQGQANRVKELDGGKEKLGNKDRECVWFSPSCKRDRRLMGDLV